MIESPQALILLLLITTTVCMDGEWSVTYSPAQHICALEGSSIIMQCSYSHPLDLRVKDVRWVNQDTENPVDFATHGNYSDRVIVDCQEKTCSLILTNVNPADALQRYQCKITTYRGTESYTGEPGISLNVTDLQIDSSRKRNIHSGDRVILLCSTSCSLPGNPSFLWLKDGRVLEGENHTLMVLEQIEDTDIGTYSCAVRGYGDIPIPSVRLEIQTRDDSDDGKPLGVGDIVAYVILVIVVAGLVIGLRFGKLCSCLETIHPQPATIQVTVLPALNPTRPSHLQAWGNPEGTEPLIS